MSQPRSYSLQREVQLRFLSPDDIPVIKRLCEEWFPIEWVVWWQICSLCCRIHYGTYWDSQPFHSQANSLPGQWPVRSLELSLPGLFAPGPFRSMAFSLPETFTPRSEMARELSFPETFALEYSLPGTFAPLNFRFPLVRDTILRRPSCWGNAAISMLHVCRHSV